MKRPRSGARAVVAGMALGVLQVLPSGCASVGPRAIGSGRLDYAEVISTTEDEQLLLSIVKGRYGESISLLEVTGVAANVRFRVDASLDFGIHLGPGAPDDAAAGGAVAYEENPTITYRPVTGEHFVRQLLSPLPLDVLVLALRSMTFDEGVLVLLVSKVNGVRNPDFVDGPLDETASRFRRFAALYSTLNKAGVLEFFRNERDEAPFNLLIRGYAPEHASAVRELLDLLDLPEPDETGADIVIPVHFGANPEGSPGLAITTRTTFDLVEILRAAVEVPEPDAAAGLVVEFPPMGLPGQGLRIHASTSRPDDSVVAVRHRGYWFFIRDSDQVTKAAFGLLRTFWAFASTNPAADSNIPVMTIPLSR